MVLVSFLEAMSQTMIKRLHQYQVAEEKRKTCRGRGKLMQVLLSDEWMRVQLSQHGGGQNGKARHGHTASWASNYSQSLQLLAPFE